jgi:hypothetical protein
LIIGVDEVKTWLIVVVKDSRPSRGLRCLVCIVNTNRELIDFLETIGGPKARWRKGTNKPVGDWHVCSVNDAWRFLTQIKPWLIVKKKAATEALEILKGRRRAGNRSKAYYRWHTN